MSRATLTLGLQLAHHSNAAHHLRSHLQGMLSRTIRLLEAGVKPVFVFDGKPPAMKEEEVRLPCAAGCSQSALLAFRCRFADCQAACCPCSCPEGYGVGSRVRDGG